MESQMTFVKCPIEKLELEECEDSKALLKNFKEIYEAVYLSTAFSNTNSDKEEGI